MPLTCISIQFYKDQQTQLDHKEVFFLKQFIILFIIYLFLHRSFYVALSVLNYTSCWMSR